MAGELQAGLRGRRDALTLQLPDGRIAGLARYGLPGGQPVLALHGAPACRVMFEMADDAARAAGIELVAPDRPGYGLSPPDIAPTLASRAAFLQAIADALGLGRFAVLGISGGAPYAVALAERLGQRVCGLALVSPMGPAADYAATSDAKADPIPFLQRRFFLNLGQRQWLTRPGAALVARAAMTAPRRIVGLGARIGGGRDRAVLERESVFQGMTVMLREAFRHGASGAVSDLAIYGAPWGIDYSRVSAPSIIWQGDRDRIVPVAAALHLARQLPRARLIRLEGEGHFWVLTHIPEVVAEVAHFFDAVPAPVSGTTRGNNRI